ncbi:MAG: Hsp20/alpha crystallin family protein [Gammaproteobacteria bacterium]
MTAIEQKILQSLDDPGPQPFPSFNPFALGGSVNADPFAAVQGMQQRMDALLQTMLGPSPLGFNSGLLGNMGLNSPGSSASFSMSTPAIRIDETDREYQIHVTVPQSHEVELNTEIEGNTLSISGKIQQQLAQQNGGSAATFIGHSQFSRQIPLSHEVDELGIATEQTPTGLMVRVPKKTGQYPGGGLPPPGRRPW